METFHNPDQFMSDLRQILSQGRKRIGLLVGAGAPFAIRVDTSNVITETGEPLIPNVDQLTQSTIACLQGKQATAVKAIQTQLDPEANIEKILSRVRLLEEALGSTPINDLDGAGYGDLAKAICAKIGEVAGAKLPKGSNAYTELVAWISGTLRDHAVEVFTTNYDLLFEEAFESARAPYFDGFSGGSAPFFDPVTVAGDDLPPRWSRLWKLHGSLGWALESGAVVRGRGREKTELIYPDHLKYNLTQKQPYSALFERLKQFLLTPDTLLLATGFSFRDQHVCAVLDEALAMNANAAVFAFQFQNLTAETAVCHLACTRPNLSVYAADGAVISGVPGKWRLGELPKNWEDVRASFWKGPGGADPAGFLLGDFNHFARFCALTHATDMRDSRADVELSSKPIDTIRSGDTATTT
jgi:hypothetical protein